MKKCVFIIVISFINLFFLTGCIYSNDELKIMKQYEKQAEKNAINYVKNKYKFNAKVISTKLEKVDTSPIPDFTPAPTGDAFVLLKANNNKFYVYITGTENSIDGADNYQYETIKSDVVKTFKDLIPFKLHKHYLEHSYYVTSDYPGLIKTYYNGANLKDIVKELGLSIQLNYIGNINLEDVDLSKINDIISNSYVVSFVSYNNKENYENSINLNDDSFTYFPESYIKERSSYINNALLFVHGEKQYYKYN